MGLIKSTKAPKHPPQDWCAPRGPEGPKGPKGLIAADPVYAVPVSAYVGSSKNLKDLKDLRKGEVFAYVGRNQNLKDLKDVAYLYMGSSALTPRLISLIGV